MTTDMGRDATQDVVELSFTPQVEDFASALRARLRVSRLGWIQRWAPFAMALGVIAEIVSATTGSGDFSPSSLVTLVLIGALFPLTPWLQARTVKRLAEGRGVFRVVVSESGVTVTNDHSTTSVAWAAQPRYRETPRVFVLLSDDKNATGFTMLPKRALPDPSDIDRLRAILDHHLTRA